MQPITSIAGVGGVVGCDFFQEVVAVAGAHFVHHGTAPFTVAVLFHYACL